MGGHSWTGSGCVWPEGRAEMGAGASEGASRQCKKDLRPSVPLHALVAITALSCSRGCSQLNLFYTVKPLYIRGRQILPYKSTLPQN